MTGTSFRTTDAGVVARYRQFEHDHTIFAARVAEIMRTLDLPATAYPVQTGYGAVQFIAGIKTRDDVIPTGWRQKEVETTLLVPDEDEHEGRIARILLDSLENVPNSRMCLLDAGMYTDLVISPEDGTPYVEVPGVELIDGAVVVTWLTASPFGVSDIWERVA